MRMVAVVLGGGTGQRAGAALPKQLLRLGGRTLLKHCVAAFEQAPGVDEILVVMAADWVDRVREMLAAGGFGKVSGVIAGGAARSDSTRAALAALCEGGPDDCGVVLRYLPGVAVHIVPGSERNLKITYPQDLAVAEALLAQGAAR
jgi:2-C-methyl-D-erythritol 4-phosphate cytidylyltransferase